MVEKLELENYLILIHRCKFCGLEDEDEEKMIRHMITKHGFCRECWVKPCICENKEPRKVNELAYINSLIKEEEEEEAT